MLSPESTVSHTTNKTHTVAQLMRIIGGGEEDGGLGRLSAELDVGSGQGDGHLAKRSRGGSV